ncbi:MAG: hypothetical protein GX633_02195 [Clostridiales bacterium]|nr:hypothetical protein [Clostridiales bacterium]
MDIHEFFASLGIEKYPDCFSDFYDEVMDDYDKVGAGYISPDLVRYLDDKYGLFPTYRDVLCEAADTIAKNENLCRYVHLLRRMMHDPSLGSLAWGMQYPKAPSPELEIAYRICSIFAHLSAAEDTINELIERDVPRDIIDQSMKCFDSCIRTYKRRFGMPGYNETYFAWGLRYVLGCRILQIGSFNFEIVKSLRTYVSVYRNKKGEYRLLFDGCTLHREGQILGSAKFEDPEGSYRAELIETDEYVEGYVCDTWNCRSTGVKERLSKHEWTPIFKPGDPVISVHIPRGADVSKKAADDSYRLCLEIFGRCYPEFKPLGFYCGSWLMDPQLRDMVREGSNIVSFQSKFLRFPAKSEGRGVFTFLFPDASIKRHEDLPENTSLERAVKRHYLEGKYIYEQSGIFFDI